MEQKPWWANRQRPTGNQKQAIFEVLDGRLGCDRIEDYDSAQDALQVAIEIVEEYDELMMGCGVGPLMSDIKDWMKEWESGHRPTGVSAEKSMSARSSAASDEAVEATPATSTESPEQASVQSKSPQRRLM